MRLVPPDVADALTRARLRRRLGFREPLVWECRHCRRERERREKASLLARGREGGGDG